MFETQTNRLELRNCQHTDARDLYEYAKSDLVGPSAGWPVHKSLDESQEIIKMFIKDNDVLAIVLKSQNKVIGTIGLHKRVIDENFKESNQREIGFALNPAYWGNAYIPEAINALLKIGFEKMNLDLIWCSHFQENKKSKRVIEKCEFQYMFKKEKTLNLLNNKRVNSLYYSINKEQYLSRKTRIS